MYLKFPFQLDSRRNVAESDLEDHLRELIEEVLLVSPGERVNRPDFGCPLIERVFAGETDENAIATKTMVQIALQRWLGLLIQVVQIGVEIEGEQLIVVATVSYQGRQLEARVVR